MSDGFGRGLGPAYWAEQSGNAARAWLPGGKNEQNFVHRRGRSRRYAERIADESSYRYARDAARMAFDARPDLRD